MKNKITAILLISVLTFSCLSGCKDRANTAKVPKTGNEEIKPQLVVAANPSLVFDGRSSVIAFNDVKNAMAADRKAATLTTLYDETDWAMVYKTGEDWKKHGIYGIEKWHNGAHISSDKLGSYSFSDDGTISLMPYTTAAARLGAYEGGTPSEAGLLVSVSGNEQNALCYQIKEDGYLAIPAGKLTAIDSVGEIKTGFLAEDNDSRSAAVEFIVNTRVLWSGEFVNSTAGDGTAVTELSYPDIGGIEVNAGDKFFLSFKLDAKANKPEDIKPTNPAESSGKKDNDTAAPTEQVTDIPIMDGYDSHFKIVRSDSADIKEQQIVAKLRSAMVSVLEADVITVTDEMGAAANELLIGRTNRPESVKAYDELTSYRANNGSDFIIRMDSGKLVIAANTDYSLQRAVNYFLEKYCNSDKAKLPSNLNYCYRPELKNITIGDRSIASFTIRTEKYPSVMAVKAAENLAQYVIEKTGYKLKIEKDTAETANEILVGMTTRSGISAETFKSKSLDLVKGLSRKTLGNDDYSIFIKSGKLFLEAGSDYAANFAVTQLIAKLKESGTLTSDFTLSGNYKKKDYALTDAYAYTWGDEFNGSSLNRKNWVLNSKFKIRVGPYYSSNDAYHLSSKKSLDNNDPNDDFGGPWINAGNGFMQEGYLKNTIGNSTVENNMLVQTVYKTSEGYNENVICTDGRMEFRYGILEARIMQSSANGSISAFWTRTRDGAKVVNEIDISETFGEDKIKPNLHTWGSAHTDHGSMISVRNIKYPQNGEHFYDTFHHLAVEWTPDFINMYLDGELYLSQDITSDTWAAFKETTYVVFSCTVPSGDYADGNNPGSIITNQGVNQYAAARLFDRNGDGRIDINDFCEKQYVDYLRLYQINSRKYSLSAK